MTKSAKAIDIIRTEYTDFIKTEIANIKAKIESKGDKRGTRAAKLAQWEAALTVQAPATIYTRMEGKAGQLIALHAHNGVLSHPSLITSFVAELAKPFQDYDIEA